MDKTFLIWNVLLLVLILITVILFAIALYYYCYVSNKKPTKIHAMLQEEYQNQLENFIETGGQPNPLRSEKSSYSIPIVCNLKTPLIITGS